MTFQANSIADLRAIARRRLPRAVFDFIDGGAEDELTMCANRTAFERRPLLPRVLVDVSQPDTRLHLLGADVAAPLLVAPMGSVMVAWPQADLAIARAAASLGLPYTMSTMSGIAIERLAEMVQGTLWFQLYVLKDQALNLRLLERARDAGYAALVVTVDLSAAGKRERDLRNGLRIPLRFSGRHAWGAVTHPRWALQMLRAGVPAFENVRDAMGEGAGLTIAARVGENLDATFGWDDLARLRERWPRELVVKGVMHPADAERLVAMGVDGLWVSNHGGRQLDGACATADALPAIAQAVHGRAEVVVDSGVRRGVDLLKARALGAHACAVGRAALWGACAGGEAGARHALGLLLDELKLAMKLSGVRDMAAASDPGLLAP